LIVWALAQSRGYGHCSLVTPERVLSKYNEDLILILYKMLPQRFFALMLSNYFVK